jgi:hypothetical protein
VLGVSVTKHHNFKCNDKPGIDDTAKRNIINAKADYGKDGQMAQASAFRGA